MTPNVSDTGSVTDIDGAQLYVGTDHDSVTIGPRNGPRWRFTRSQLEDFIRLAFEADTRVQQYEEENREDEGQ